jgi:hypothetical protein
VAGNVVRRQVGEELDDGVDAGLLQAPESHGSICGRATKPGGGLGRQKCHQWRSISVEAELTCNGGRGEIQRRERAGRG